MKKISSFIVKARYVLLGIFVALVGLCSFLMSNKNGVDRLSVFIFDDKG